MGAKDLARVTVKAVALERDLRNPREVKARDLYRLLRNHRMEKDLTRVTVKVVRPRNRRVEKGLIRATVKVVRPRNHPMAKDLTRATVNAVTVERDLRSRREVKVRDLYRPLRNRPMEKDLTRATVKAVRPRNRRMEKDLTRATVKVVRPRNRRVERDLIRAIAKVVRPRNRRMEKDLTRATVKAVRPRNRRMEKDLKRAREDLVLAEKEPFPVRVLCQRNQPVGKGLRSPREAKEKVLYPLLRNRPMEKDLTRAREEPLPVRAEARKAVLAEKEPLPMERDLRRVREDLNPSLHQRLMVVRRREALIMEFRIILVNSVLVAHKNIGLVRVRICVKEQNVNCINNLLYNITR